MKIFRRSLVPLAAPLAAALITVALAGCVADLLGIADETYGGEVGPEGGEVSGYGVTLIFEPGDLPWPIEIEIDRWDNPKPLPDGFSRVGTPVKISPFGQIVNGSYEIRWDVADISADGPYFIFIWDTVNAEYQLGGVGYETLEVSGYGHFLHNMTLAVWNGDGRRQNSNPARDRRPQPLAFIDGHDAVFNLNLYEAGGGAPLDGVRIEVGLQSGSPNDGWHLVSGDEISGLLASYSGYNGFQADRQYTTTNGRSAVELVTPNTGYQNGAGTAVDGLVYRLDFYYQDELIRDHYFIELPANDDPYEEYYLELPLRGDYQHGDPDDDGEGSPPDEQPQKTAPENGDEIDTTRPTFSWNSVEGADRYKLLLSGDELELEIAPIADEYYTYSEPLTRGADYQWTVLAGNADGWCGQTPEWWSFSVAEDAQGNRDPEPPAAVYPPDGADYVPVDATLEWSCSDPDGDDLTYDVYLGLDPDLDATDRVADDIGETSFQPEVELEFATLYYWKVVAYDGNGGDTENTSSTWSFQTVDEGQDTPPEAPSLIAPPNHAGDVPLRPTFEWAAVRDGGRPQPRPYLGSTPTPTAPADDYQLQVDDDIDFSSPVIDEVDLEDTSYTPTADLTEGVTYYWRVRGENTYGFGPWSAVWDFTTESDWFLETVDDGTEILGTTSLALDSNGLPHISYTDNSSGELMYAHWDGASWQLEAVTGAAGRNSSLVVDAADRPHISFHDTTNNDLMYASWNGSAWEIETVDSLWHVGQSNVLQLDSFDYPHIIYTDITNGDLKYAYWDGAAWNTELADSGADADGISLALDSNDLPHVTYHDYENDFLVYTYYDGSDWRIELVDYSSNTGFYTSLDLDAADRPHVTYSDDSYDVIRYAYKDGGWQIETVASAGVTYTNLELDSSGTPHVIFDWQGLQYAYLDGDWVIEYVGDSGTERFDLELDGADIPHVSYSRDSIQLRYGYRNP